MKADRFFTLPNVLKPILLVLTLILMFMVGLAKVKVGEHETGSWFFWLNIIIQFVWTVIVCIFFLLEIESLLTCGRSAWPLCETVYSGVLFVLNLVNTFMIASWVSAGKDGTLIAAALVNFAIMVLYALSGFMMFRAWRGFVQSGTTQNPTPNIQPGNIGQMHPGV